MSERKEKKKRAKGQRAFRVVLIIMLLLMILVIAMGFVAYLLLNHYTGMIQHVEEDITMASGETLEEETEETGTNSPDEVVVSIEDILNDLIESKEDVTNLLPEVPKDQSVLNILLIGIDARADKNSGRSDAMILLSINRESKQITLTSFLRDMYVAIPGRGNNRINAAHAYGGGNLLMETIELNFGIHIDYFARVNFYSFVSVIDAAGGVDIDVDSKELPYVNSYLKEINKLQGLSLTDSALSEGQTGLLHLNGRQALSYARIRYVGSDYARTERQREVIFAVVNQMKKMSVFELNSFLNEALPQISTNMDQGMLNSLVLEVPTLLGYSIQQHRVPADGTGTGMRIDGKSVIAVDLAQNRTLLNQIIYGR